MKKSFFIIIAIVFSFTAFSQDKKDKTIKIFTRFQHSSNYLFGDNEKKLLVTPSFSFAINTKKGNYHELQFLGFTRTREKEYLYSSTFTRASLRYSYNLAFFKAKDYALKPVLGFATVPFYQKEKLDARTSTRYSRTWYSAGVLAELIPKLNWDISSRVFLELNLPIRIFELNYTQQYVGNPIIPNDQQTTGGIEFEIAHYNFEMNIGIGIRL